MLASSNLILSDASNWVCGFCGVVVYVNFFSGELPL